MKNRLLLMILAFQGLRSTGLTPPEVVAQRIRLINLCGGGWIPLCMEETERKRQVYVHGLERLGLLDAVEEPEALFLTILEAEKKYGLDYRLLTSVAVTESALNLQALSNKGARGLLQILPETAQHLWPEFLQTLDSDDPLRQLNPVQDAYDPRLSVMLGAFYLSRLYANFGDQGLALASYNMGPARVRKSLKDGVGVPVMGLNYVRKVRSVFRKFETVQAFKAI